MQKICVLIINKKSKFSITFLFFLTNWILSHYFLLIFCFICIFFSITLYNETAIVWKPNWISEKNGKVDTIYQVLSKEWCLLLKSLKHEVFRRIVFICFFHLVYAKIEFHLSCFQSILSLLHKKVLCLF